MSTTSSEGPVQADAEHGREERNGLPCGRYAGGLRENEAAGHTF